jgi:hypothetical protein
MSLNYFSNPEDKVSTRPHSAQGSSEYQKRLTPLQSADKSSRSLRAWAGLTCCTHARDSGEPPIETKGRQIRKRWRRRCALRQVPLPEPAP